jgi:hypothetical protein
MHENLRMWEFQKKFACPPLVLITEITTLKPAVLRFKIRMVFGPSGSWSGSVSQRYGSRFRSGSEPFYHHAKIVKKTSIPTVLWLLYNFLFLKNDVNVTSISNKQKNIEFFFTSWMSLMKIAGFGSVTQCYASMDPYPYRNHHVTDPQHWKPDPRFSQPMTSLWIRRCEE